MGCSGSGVVEGVGRKKTQQWKKIAMWTAENNPEHDQKLKQHIPQCLISSFSHLSLTLPLTRNLSTYDPSRLPSNACCILHRFIFSSNATLGLALRCVAGRSSTPALRQGHRRPFFLVPRPYQRYHHQPRQAKSQGHLPPILGTGCHGRSISRNR